MIDFSELPKDGKAFEQFVREVLLICGVRPHWTGQGPDQGRDIVAKEILIGPIAEANRTWLVQCKHFAHSNRSVGRDDVGSIVDDCRQVAASGYLLVCSTQPSAPLVTKLREISNKPEAGLFTLIWDSVDLEKMLQAPRFFALGHLFFPKSFASTPWKLYNRGSPSQWSAHYKSYFMHLTSRIAGMHPNLAECEFFVGKLEEVAAKGADEHVRPRAIFFDDKNGHFIVYADYLVPHDRNPTLRPSDFNAVLQDGVALRNFTANWDIQLKRIDPGSDHFHLDHDEYYNPTDGGSQSGITRGPAIGQLSNEDNEWR
jgi:hypothetical protein